MAASDTRRLKVVVDGEATGGVRALNDLNKHVQSSESNITKFGVAAGKWVARAGVALGAAGSAAGAFGLKTAIGLENAKVAFTNMLGSGEKADTFLKQLQQFANKTPFEFPDLVVASQRLLAMGFSSKQLIPTLTAVGDAVAAMGGGKDQVQAVVTALGQMQAKGRITGEELMQMTEQGIPALQILADSFGVSTAKMSEMISKGLVPADKGIAALTKGLEHGTKNVQSFGGMMDKQSLTMAGRWSSFMDSLQTGLGSLVVKAAPLLGKFLGGATTQFNNFFAGLEGKGKLSGFDGTINHIGLGLRALFSAMKEGDVTSDGFVGVMERIGVAIRGAWGHIKDFAANVKTAFYDFSEGFRAGFGANPEDALNRFGVGFQKAGAIAKGFVDWVTGTLIPVIGDLVNWVKNSGAPAFGQFLVGAFSRVVAIGQGLASWVVNTLWPALQKVGSFLRDTFTPTWHMLVKVWQTNLLPALQSLQKAFNDNKTQLAAFFKAIGIVIGGILAIATAIIGKLLPILAFLVGVALRGVIEIFKILIITIGVVVRTVQGVWKAFQTAASVISSAMRAVGAGVREGVRIVVMTFLNMVGTVLEGAAKAFGWVPGLGGKLKAARDSFNTFRDGVNRSLAGVKDKNVQVRVQLGAGKAVVGSGAAAIRIEKEGGILRRFANGVENHVAQIAKGGEWRVWAEDETEGEAYIPLARSKRTRSMSILSQVAKKFGHAVIPAARGLIIDPRLEGKEEFDSKIRAYDKDVTKFATRIGQAVKSLTGFSADLAGVVRFARSQHGKPYVWGGAGPGGADCSGFVSELVNVAQGRYAYSRRFSTATLPAGLFDSHNGAFKIGWFTGNPGHVAATVNGVHMESRGGDGIVVNGMGGKSSRGSTYSYFTRHGSLKGFAEGGILPGDPPFDLLSKRGRHYKPGLLEALIAARQSFDNGVGRLQPGYNLTYNGTGKDEWLSPQDSTPIIINITVEGSVIQERDLAKTITSAVRDELKRIGNRNGGRTGLS